MKKPIQVTMSPLGDVSAFEVSDLRLVSREGADTINYQVAFYDAGGQQLTAKRAELSAADYASWCSTGAGDSNEGFILALEASRRGLTIIAEPAA